MMRTERRSLWPSSRKARTVMPTEVAVSAVAMNSAELELQPKRRPTSAPVDERQHGAEDGDLDRRGARLHELVDVGLEAGHEQQHDDAQLGHGVHDLARVDEPQQLRPQDGAGEEFADHDRQLEALEQVPEQARAGEGEEDHEQRVGVSGHGPSGVVGGILLPHAAEEDT